jgi:hypothetical protein
MRSSLSKDLANDLGQKERIFELDASKAACNFLGFSFMEVGYAQKAALSLTEKMCLMSFRSSHLS